MTTGRQSRNRRAVAARWVDSRLTRERTLVYPALIAGGFALVLVISWFIPHGALPLPDFTARWTAGRLLADGAGATLYDPYVQSTVQTRLGAHELSWFVSPPFVAAMFVPLGLLPYQVACAVWVVVIAASLAGATSLIQRTLALPTRMSWLRVTVPVIGSYPLLELVGAGQDTGLVLLLVLLGWRLLRGGHDSVAGVVFALGLIKPHLILLVPVLLLLHRRWRALGMFIVTAVGLLVVSVLLVGADGVLTWLNIARDPLFTTQVQAAQAWKQVSVPGLILGVLPPAAQGGWQILAYAAGLVIALRALPWMARGDITALRPWATALGVTLVASPHVMVYDLVLALPLIVVLFTDSWTPVSRALLAVTYCALWLMPVGRAVFQGRPWPLSILGAPWVAVLIAALLCLSTKPVITRDSTQVD